MRTDAFPLQWPEGQKRTKFPMPSKFKVGSFGKVRDEVVSQLKLMRATHVVISTNIPLRNDGLPYANFKTPSDAGVAIYFLYKGKQMVFACDKWKKIEDNLQAINKTIDAVRGIERWGSSEMMERAFSGFAQLETPSDNWWVVLGVDKNTSLEVIKEQYRIKAKKAHPDMGGSSLEMANVNKAYESAKKDRGLL